MARDFPNIGAIVAGVLACLDRPPTAAGGGAPYRVYNLGNNRAEPLMRFIAVIEATVGRKAKVEFLPLQAGDVVQTYADIEPARRELGFEPSTTIDAGLPRFVAWYRDHYRV